MIRRIDLDGPWQVGESDGLGAVPGEWIDATVPGDVHADLCRAGKLPADLFYRKNLLDAKWVEERHWWYRREFSGAALGTDSAELVFDGLDTFAEVCLNGEKIGEADNMHRQFRFDVGKNLRVVGNELIVKFLPTRERLRELHDKFPQYHAIFTPGRSLVRKAQCQFGWDWAPEALSLGIWKDARIEIYDARTIRDVAVETSIAGDLCFRVAMASDCSGLELEVQVGEGTNASTARAPVDGHNSFVNLKLENPRLWWPNGMGGQHLYSYTIRLINGSVACDVRRGTFGIRNVAVEESVIEPGRIGFRLRVNGVPVFCKGANSVPANCFPGTIADDTYDYLIDRAAEANFNMIRVWGGGIYNHDRFYEQCDRRGIMVWQDFMTACAQYPDDQPWFIDSMLAEAEYQVKRLRNHPCIVVWCGGNESSSSHRYTPNQPGRRLAHYYLRGVVGDLAGDTPYVYSSPHSKSDFGQIQTSGESHWSTWSRTPDVHYGDFRERLKDIKTVFNGEICLQGPSPLESARRFATDEDLWPPNDVIDYHVMHHPANPKTHPRFVISQKNMAEETIGPCTDARSFIANAMMAHAEMVREELQFYRSRKFGNSGALLWMYNECWPCANWAILDYYGYAKPAYYAAKAAFAPLAVCIKRVHNEFTVHLMNDTRADARGNLCVRCMDIDGHVYWSEHPDGHCAANQSVQALAVAPDRIPPKAHFLWAEWAASEEAATATYFVPLWRDVPFRRPRLEWTTLVKNQPVDCGFRTEVQVRSENYARFVFLHLPETDIHGICFSDQYFDLIPGEDRVVRITSRTPVDMIEVSALCRG